MMQMPTLSQPPFDQQGIAAAAEADAGATDID